MTGRDPSYCVKNEWCADTGTANARTGANTKAVTFLDITMTIQQIGTGVNGGDGREGEQMA